MLARDLSGEAHTVEDDVLTVAVIGYVNVRGIVYGDGWRQIRRRPLRLALGDGRWSPARRLPSNPAERSPPCGLRFRVDPI